MTRYTFGIENPHQQYIHISVEFETKGDSTTLQLPSWRPGRYELGNFAKNINNLKVYNSKVKVIAAEKLNKDSWIIDTSKTDSIKVEYKYYAIEMNAGSSFLDKDQL
ncbi:MAG: putative metalloprotease with PDZ domain, partial [Crocinitomicaceae bacterium]